MRDTLLQRLSGVQRGSERGDHDLNPAGARHAGPLTPAAVLVPIIDRPERLTVLFTKRTPHLSKHAGQVSFPGGRIEDQDPDAVACALRETEEEIGLDRRLVQVLGELDRYVTGTGFAITPVVGLVAPHFELKADPHEVAEVFEVPLDFLLDPYNHQRHSGMFNGQERHWFAMPYGEHYIWGATAGMLVNLYHIVRAA
ncbi:MAG TPA: CoA pyrophosphatase [Candidatus Cybelea sp.]|nr:CoA pyrophosphatase [Candidatus Cybelea sp.]